jgi:hypothetical protein
MDINEIQKPGVYSDITNDEYHASFGISSTGLKAFGKSPAHYKAYTEKAFKETPALRIGKIIHEAILEPEKFNSVVWDGPVKRGKAWEQFQNDNHGRHILTVTERDMLDGMTMAVMAHSRASRLVASAGWAEVSAWWVDPVSGELCKCRPDKWRKDGVLVDLKTCEDASPEGFAKSVYNYGYHLQAAFYLDGAARAIRQSGRTDLEIPSEFFFVAVEKEPPYAVGVYNLDYEAMEIGRDRYSALLLEYSRCRVRDEWPAYKEELVTLGLPAWAIKKELAA